MRLLLRNLGHNKMRRREMKDFNGTKIHVGDILLSAQKEYRRVDYVGKKRIITAMCSFNIADAKMMERDGTWWMQDAINEFHLTIVETAPLGVYDKHGKQYHRGDTIKKSRGCDQEVFRAIKSICGDGVDYVFIKNKDTCAGWVSRLAKDYEIVRRAWERDAIDTPSLETARLAGWKSPKEVAEIVAEIMIWTEKKVKDRLREMLKGEE